MPDIINVQIRFSIQTEIGEFNDALFIPLAEYDTMTSEQIDILKQARVDAWVAAVKIASSNTEPVE